MRRFITVALTLGLAGCLGTAPEGAGAEPTPNPQSLAGTPSASPNVTATDQLTLFARCMQQADWDGSGMGDLQNQTTAGYGGECYSCHGTGMFGLYLSKVSTDNFTRWKTLPWALKFVTASTNPDGSFADIVQTGRIVDRGQEAGHAPFALSTARSAALDKFFQLTYAHYKAGNCP
jgi:hypothetical protein